MLEPNLRGYATENGRKRLGNTKMMEQRSVEYWLFVR